MTAKDMYASTRLAAVEGLNAGITSIHSCATTFEVAHMLRRTSVRSTILVFAAAGHLAGDRSVG